MKNRLFITLTDVNGSRQVRLTREMLIRTIVIMLAVLASLILYPLWLNHLNTKLIADNQLLQDHHDRLLGQTDELADEYQTLSARLAAKTAALNLSEQQFSELEKLVNFNTEGADNTDERYTQLASSIAFRQMTLQILPNGKPVRYDRVTSSFGHRNHPLLKANKLHQGIDVNAKMGSPVIATADGVVTSTQYTADGYGKLVKVTHAMGFITYYGHLKKITVSANQFVNKGDIIGYSGNSGSATGPHLHYEVRFAHKAYDPAHFMLWTLDNFDQPKKIEEIPWASLMASLQKLMSIKPQPLSQMAATSTESSTLTVACTSTDGCPATSAAPVPSPSASPDGLMAK